MKRLILMASALLLGSCVSDEPMTCDECHRGCGVLRESCHKECDRTSCPDGGAGEEMRDDGWS